MLLDWQVILREHNAEMASPVVLLDCDLEIDYRPSPTPRL